MKVRYKSIYAFCVYAVLFLNLGFLDFLGDLDRESFLLSIIISVFSFLVYLSQPQKKYINFPVMNGYIVLTIVIFLIQLLRMKILNFTRMSMGSALITFGGVLLSLLCFPIYELNIDKNEKLLKNIALLGFYALVVRAFLWILFNFKGINLAPAIFSGREAWGRPIFGRYLTRLSGTFLDGFVYIYFVNNFFKLKSFNKIKYLIGIILLLVYSLIIYQSRFLILTYVIVFFVMAYSQSSSLKNKYFVISFVILIIIFCFNWIKDFFNTFSVNSVGYGGSTQARLDGIQYFFNELKRTSWWLGIGFRYDDETKYQWTTFYLSDYGMLANLFQLGIFGFVVYIIPFLKGIIISMRLKYNTLLIAFTTFLCIYSLAINPYLIQQITILPLFLGFILCGLDEKKAKSVVKTN